MRNSPLQELIGKSDIGDILNSALCRQDFGLNECIKLIKSDDIHSIWPVGNVQRSLYGNTFTFVKKCYIKIIVSQTKIVVLIYSEKNVT